MSPFSRVSRPKAQPTQRYVRSFSRVVREESTKAFRLQFSSARNTLRTILARSSECLPFETLRLRITVVQTRGPQDDRRFSPRIPSPFLPLRSIAPGDSYLSNKMPRENPSAIILTLPRERELSDRSSRIPRRAAWILRVLRY